MISNMNINKIIENINILAQENMTEDGIHHDDWPDREWEYTSQIVRELAEHYEVEDVGDLQGNK